jgi:hypothetical protein
MHAIEKDAMDEDALIAQLAAKFDTWIENSFASFASHDRMAQARELLQGIDITNELDRLKTDGIAAIKKLLNSHALVADQERAASLIRAFVFAARLADALHDELLDTKGGAEVWHLLDAIVSTLRTIGTGRAALAVLFDNPDAGVRVAAGVYLIDLMPDRVVPMLSEVEQQKDASTAHFKAMWTLLGWKLDKKSRFNYLHPGRSN